MASITTLTRTTATTTCTMASPWGAVVITIISGTTLTLWNVGGADAVLAYATVVTALGRAALPLSGGRQ
jgi:hypothetical protein